jgi:putative ABC transport system permease protein
MFKNYLLVALRNLLRHKVYSFINVSGLAIGMGCCILIALYIEEEFSYDRYHENADRIYKVLRETRRPGGDRSFSSGTSGALGPSLRSDFSEVQATVRIWNTWGGVWVNYEDRMFRQAFCLADANVLDVFTFTLIKGDPETALVDPFSVLLTEEMAQKFFGGEDPIGKVITVENRHLGGDYTITGILRDIPGNSSPSWQTGLQFDFLTSTAVVSRQIVRQPWEGWNRGSSWFPIKTYVVLPEGYPPEGLERKLPDFMERYLGAEMREKTSYRLQPLTRIHLYNNIDYGRPGMGGITFIYLLGGIAFFILVIASINFMNLATARYTTRAKEVSMRKVAGAHWLQLVQQFLGESTLLSLLALLLATGLVGSALPAFNDIVNKELSLLADLRAPVILVLFGFAILVGLMAGSYPAFFLSSLKPVAALKGTFRIGSKGLWSRKGLVVFQFSISILIIIGAVVVKRQVDYIHNKDLGFRKDHILLLPVFYQARDSGATSGGSLSKDYNLVKQAFSQHPNVLKTSASATYGTAGGWQTGTVLPEGQDGSGFRMPILGVDENFLDTYEIKLLSGRNFSKEITSDQSEAFILNETAVKQFGWTDPIGKQLEWENRLGTVIGVVRDFHHQSLRQEIGPIVLCMSPSRFGYISLKIRSDNIPATMAFLEETWKRFLPNRPLDAKFLVNNVNGRYGAEVRFGQISGIFSLVAILISCLGLFGLVSFDVEQRTREIGVRKTLGASVSRILFMLTRESVKWVLAANLIAWPVAYYAMDKWLQGFAYRISLDIWIFLLGGALALVIALATVSYQAFRAATANPVDALRYE